MGFTSEGERRSSRINSPRLGQRLDQVGPRLHKVVVHPPAAGNPTRATFSGSLESEQADDISCIGVEDLLVSRVGRCPDGLRWCDLREVLDVCEDARVAVLHPTQLANIRGDAGVDEDNVLAGVGVNGESANDDEAAAGVELAREVLEDGAKGWEGERVTVDATVWNIQACESGKGALKGDNRVSVPLK